MWNQTDIFQPPTVTISFDTVYEKSPVMTNTWYNIDHEYVVEINFSKNSNRMTPKYVCFHGDSTEWREILPKVLLPSEP